MTNSEAIHDLEKILRLKFTGSNRPESMSMAIRSLRFGIERKPSEDDLCPNCGAEVRIVTAYGTEIYCNTCYNCGQAIDWGRQNETD